MTSSSPAPTPVGAPGWLAEDKVAAEKLLTNARSVREELAQPSMLGKLAPGWGFWPDVEKAAIRWAASVAALEAVLAHAGRWEGSVTGARYAKIVREAVAAELASPYPGAEVLRRIDAAAVADDDLDDFDAAEAARDTQGGAANG